MYLSTQVFLFIQRAKEGIIKHIPKILGFVNKIKSVAKKFEKKHPTVYKVAMLSSKIAIAMVAIYVVSSIFGGNQAIAGDMVDYKGKVMANEQQLQMLGKALSSSQDVNYQKAGQFMLDIANSAENIRGDVGQAGMQITMPNSEMSHDIFKAFKGSLKHGTATLDQMVADGDLSSEYSNLTDSALELLKTVPEPPPLPSAPITAPGNVIGDFHWPDVLEQMEMANQLNSKPDSGILKLVNIAAKGHPKIDPEITKRAQELLSQVK